MGDDERSDIRAADVDRDTMARRLATAASEGRIGVDELEDRLARIHEARTYGDLEELVRDLPRGEEPGVQTIPEHTVPETLRVTASLREARLRGRWEVPPRILATAGRGTVRIDFTQAVVEHDEIIVDARPNWRNVELTVPEGYSVTTEEAVPGAGLGVRDLTTGEPEEGAPTLRIVARPGLGTTVVRHPRQRRRPRLLRRRASTA